jgi:hypothetical protein
MITSFSMLAPSRAQHRTALTIVALGAVVLTLYPVGAGDGIARFSVGALVQAQASMSLRTNPNVVAVSPQDVAQGYVDVPVATQVDVSSNSRDGYVLNVLPVSNLFTKVQVRGLDSHVELGPDGGAVVQRWSPSERRRSLSLTYRFQLAQGVQPGNYPWPLQLNVTPL